MSLAENRQAIRLLLDERNPGDAMAAYYAFHHDDRRTQIRLLPAGAAPGRATGFVTTSQTGLDLFRPLLTMRLPVEDDVEKSGELLSRSLPRGMEAFIACPQGYMPLIKALFEVQREDLLQILMLSPGRFQPLVNVLVTREDMNGLPRFVIKQEVDGRREAVAAAGLNWQSPYFGEIAVRTRADQRRRGFGRSVVAALVQHLLQEGRRPLYAVSGHNAASLDLATSLGFVDTGYRQYMLEVRTR